MESATDKPLEFDLGRVPEAAATSPCPVDRLPRRRRNKVCIRVIAIGAANFVAYTILYAALGGDAHNGERRVSRLSDGGTRVTYVIRGHHVRSIAGKERQVSASQWIYSYLHSISVLITSGAMIISMLVLARPDILATMRDGWISGRTFITAFATLVVLITLAATTLFGWDFISQLSGGLLAAVERGA